MVLEILYKCVTRVSIGTCASGSPASQAWLLVIHKSDLNSQINRKTAEKGDLFNVAHIRGVRERDPVLPAPQIQ